VDPAVRGEDAQERAGRPVEPEDVVGPLAVDVQVAVGPKDQLRGLGQPAPGAEDVHEGTGGAVVPQDLIGRVAADVEVAVGPERDTAGTRQPAAPWSDEVTNELASVSEFQDGIGPVAPDQPPGPGLRSGPEHA